ncbi:MAG TPA: Atxe2 family lasso peptide isopeptidase [Vitreimonas sp.]|uniref:Atxe2 family lasso peptide isopeptidase n=1 Tax=Vitreimonas sp. TaxID=3069702 RepID=UPI002D2E852A|nr:Atxe2 family lasso peptide isopeptidase [Vitreimonas sp.]HYD86040.1 Atxe2 family lasso peptide isopeptidase [Vitreimonas sp.]
MARILTHALTLTLTSLWLAFSSMAQARPLSLLDLVTLRDLDGLAVSPDGRWATFMVRQADPVANAYDQAWYVVSTAGGGAHRIADGGDVRFMEIGVEGRRNGTIITTPPIWSYDSEWLFYLRRNSGQTQIWRSRRDGRRSEQLSNVIGDVRNLMLAADGRSILFEVEPSLAEREAALAHEGRRGFLFDERFWPTYSQRPVRPVLRAAERRQTWVHFLENGEEREATTEERAEFQRLSEQASPRHATGASGAVARVTPPAVPSQSATLTVQFHNEPAVIQCQAAACASATDVWWTDGDEVIFARWRRPDLQLYSWRPRQGTEPRLIVELPNQGSRPYYWDCDTGPSQLICLIESVTDPRRVVSVDIETGASRTLFDPNPSFQEFDLGPPPRRLEFRTASSSAYGYLVMPPDRRSQARLPLIIVTYRCYGYLRGGVGDEYPIYPFAAQGFAVLCLDLPSGDRGPGDAGKRSVQETISAAVSQLDSMGLIDPHRVGITGLSYGAEAVMFALFNAPNIAAAIASGTEMGPASAFLYGPSWRDHFVDWELDWRSDERWRAISITENASRVRAPLLLNVPDRELISALHPFDALRQAGRPVEMHVLPDEYHIKWQPAHRLAIYSRNLDWMNFWLRSFEDPDPAKAAQYARWRLLRENAMTPN